jgi:hypothetical protein
MKHLLGDTQNSVPVYVNLIQSKASSHIAQHPRLLNLATEALQTINLDDDYIRMEHDMQRNIGYDFVVDTSDTDTVFYAQLLRDDIYTRFVKAGEPAQSQHLVLILQRDEEGSYELLDTWIGRITPPRPGDGDENVQSRPYWASHALIRDTQPIQSRTLTKVCPY